MNLMEDQIIEKLEAEIVIIGGGGGGLAAAVAAAENGVKDIVLLEKLKHLGGNAAIAHGLFAADSPAQKRAGIKANVDELFKVFIEYAHWKVNPRLVRTVLNRSADTIQWLEGKGLEFDVIPLYNEQETPTWHVPKGFGVALTKVLAQNCKDLGVKIFLNNPAKKILTSANGEVEGVLAQTEEKGLKISAQCVIIATGGFAGNKELLNKYCPQYPTYLPDNLTLAGLPHKGDGLIMAMEVGANTEGLVTLQGLAPATPRGMFVRDESHGSGIKSVRLARIVQEAYTLWVNKNGERFMDESFGVHRYHFNSMWPVVRQPGSISYTLFDSQIRQRMIEQGLTMEKGAIPFLEKGLQAQVEKGRLKIADSWNEIADWIGAVPGELKATIDEYNASCDRGIDSLFVKDQKYLIPLRTAPYYAIKAYPSLGNTIGGIKINERMEVLNKQDNPIPGLYAVGADTGGWESENYCSKLSGNALAFPINQGRIAAENSIKYMMEK